MALVFYVYILEYNSCFRESNIGCLQRLRKSTYNCHSALQLVKLLFRYFKLRTYLKTYIENIYHVLTTIHYIILLSITQLVGHTHLIPNSTKEIKSLSLTFKDTSGCWIKQREATHVVERLKRMSRMHLLNLWSLRN